ncbi:MAG: hypothetical protein M0R51_06810 [Clostridia bacterium]|jgi:hypothetical protein|nr:hypothetical protein [Clostridia bacterium]
MGKETEATKKKKKWPWVVGAIAIVIIIGIIGGNSGDKSNTQTSVPNNQSAKTDSVGGKTENTKTSSKSDTKKSYKVTLKPGYYEVGIDIPAGTYDFEIKAGNGNVTTTSGSVNLIMGEQSDDMYQKSYKNAELSAGDTLFVQQCTIKVGSKSADTAIKGRDNSSAQEISLAAGKYTAGTDFQPGYYNITLTSGSGNVICEDNQLNAIMSKDSSVGVKEYKNVPFKSGYKLDVESAKIKLTPSK